MMKFNKNNLLLVVACKEESNNLLEKLGVKMIYTGVGKVNASYNLTKVLYKLKNQNINIKYVINVGSAGSKKFKNGSLVVCNKFIQKDMDCTAFDYYKLGETPQDALPIIIEHKRFLDDLEYGICGSGDKFETEECKIKEVEVVDMEAYALAKVCKLENIDFIAIKYITDGLEENGTDDQNNNVLDSPESFYNYLNEVLI